MKLAVNKIKRLTELGEETSGLLVKIIEEPLPKKWITTNNGNKFRELLKEIYLICPLLSDSFMEMYNYVQREKSTGSAYLKRLKHT
ncbi:hypothetical protein J4225_04365 [Candidatus Pacearchaeota archaeon]|nr:hypothetical protein [Candidatus Pacearchaeota archaeon]